MRETHKVSDVERFRSDRRLELSLDDVRSRSNVRWALRVGLVVVVTRLAFFIIEEKMTAGAYRAICIPPREVWSMFGCKYHFEHIPLASALAASAGTATSLLTKPITKNLESPLGQRTKDGAIAGLLVAMALYGFSVIGFQSPPYTLGMTTVLLATTLLALCGPTFVPESAKRYVSPVGVFVACFALLVLMRLHWHIW